MKLAASPVFIDFQCVTDFICKVFREERLRRGLSQAAVAERTGLSRTTVSQFENGKQPNVGFTFVELLAHAIGLTLIALVALAEQARQATSICSV